MTDEVKILIVARNRDRKPWMPLLRMICFAGLQVGVIGVGVWTGSAAMQWAGFSLIAIGFVAACLGAVFGEHPMTIAEARKRLDELEKR